jgi:hypothetical protein
MMRSTISKLFLVPALAAAAALIIPSAQAETVKVPFNFTAHGHSFPAGTYSVEQTQDRNMVMLHSVDSKQTFTWILAPGDPQPDDDRVVLTFSDSGDDHVLDSIQYRNKVSRITSSHRNRAETTALGQ